MASSLPPTKIPVVSDEGAGTYVKMPPTISDVEWISSYDIGTGINIVTGDIAKSPFIAVGKQRPSPMAVYYNSYVISKTSVDGCKDLVEAMAGCEDFNLAPLNFSVSVLGRVVESVRNSMSSLTCVLFWRKVSTETNYDRHGFVLSDDAMTLAALDPGAFRNMYGDYFIAHARQASIFVAVAAIKELRQSQRSSLVGKLEGGLKGLQGHITKEVDEWVSTAHAAVEIQVFMSGLPRDLPMDSDVPSLQPKSFDDVFKLLQWFQNHEIGENRSAHLQSYYSLPDVNTIPDRLGIPLDAFWEIRKIRHLLLGCTTLAKSLPMPYSETTAENSLSDRFNKVTLLLCNAQGELPTDAKRRAELDRELTLVREQLDKVHEAFAVFQTVLQHRDDEPDFRQEDPRVRWSVGLTMDFQHPVVKVHAGPSVQIRPGRNWPVLRPGGAYETIIAPPKSHIVGWEIIPDKEGTGSWRKMSASVILAREAMITCKSDAFENSVWTFKTYVVSDNEYFDNFYLQAPKSSRTSTVSDDVLQDRERIAKELDDRERIARERFAKEHAKKGKLRAYSASRAFRGLTVDPASL